MRLLTIQQNGQKKLGIKMHNGILDVEATLNKQPNDSVPTKVMDVIQDGSGAIKNLKQYVENLSYELAVYIDDKSKIDLESAVPNPGKIICVGLNYRKHADETNSPYPKEPILFNKFNNTLTGHKKDIKVPKTTSQLDYEVELGIVIGKTTKEVTKESALDSVFGYVTANDLSARDLQFASSQWLLGKCCDDFSPVGPYLVTKDEIEDPNNLNLKTIVNGKERQNSNTSDMIFHCDDIISYISKYMTLSPGDLILTGTPEGVVLGDPENERVYIQPGDEVTVEVEKVGRMTNKFIGDR